MKKVEFKNLGKELANKVRKSFDGIELGFISEDTNDWMEDIQIAEENGHFEFNYKGRVEVIDLEVKIIFDEEDNVVDTEYYI